MDPRDILMELIREGLRSVDPYEAIFKRVSVSREYLSIEGKLIKRRRTHVIGFGKASIKMTKAIYDLLSNDIVGGVVISPEGEMKIGSIEILRGDHPKPSINTERASKRLLEYLGNVEENDLVIVLISGGGSALFEIPLPGIELEDIAEITDLLMRAGADIIELNTVRKHLSAVKGGRLLRYIRSREVVSLVISDVIGDPISFIASGPTSADETTFRDAIDILKKKSLWNRISERVKRVLERGLEGEVEETIKPGDPVLSRVMNIVIASNRIALEAIEKRAFDYDLNTLFLGPYVSGEAREVGKVLVAIAKSIKFLGKPLKPPALVISGGETTVTVRGRGVGGRNQEMCLSALIELKDTPDIYVACIGTDGIDGNSPAAGAIIDNSAYREALEKSLDPREYLERNDSYTFFKKINRAIETGPTGTNVGDIYLSLVV